MTKTQQVDHPKLERLLQSIGKEFFLINFEAVRADRLEEIRQTETYTEKSVETRISKMRKIMELGLEEEALYLITQSSRMEPALRDRAREMIMDIQKTAFQRR